MLILAGATGFVGKGQGRPAGNRLPLPGATARSFSDERRQRPQELAKRPPGNRPLRGEHTRSFDVLSLRPNGVAAP
jgi:hypothetical protein